MEETKPQELQPITEEPQKKKKKEQKEEISIEKLELALYRAQMAMVRTAATMTTFGFALYKLLEEKSRESDRPVLQVITPKTIAVTLFFAGFLGLVTYSAKHVRTLKKLGRFRKSFYYSGIMLMSYILMVLTLGLFLGITIKG